MDYYLDFTVGSSHIQSRVGRIKIREKCASHDGNHQKNSKETTVVIADKYAKEVRRGDREVK